MSAKQRHSWSCLRKRAFPTREDADRERRRLLKRMPAQDRAILVVYMCGLGPHYHVGRKTDRARGKGPIPEAAKAARSRLEEVLKRRRKGA